MPSQTVAALHIDVSDFRAFARSLRSSSAEMYAELRADLIGVAKAVADEAVVRSAQHSTSIPPSIHVRLSGLSLSVVAGGNAIPLAGLFELGNSRNRKAPASLMFRHPVFGTDVWVTQEMHPYLRPALEGQAETLKVAAIGVLETAVKRAADIHG